MALITIANPSLYADDTGEPTSGGVLLNDLNTVFNESNLKEARLTAIESGTFTFNGLKTFALIPTLPSSNPTTANQAVRKGYVDSLTASGVPAHGMDIGVPTYVSANTFTVSYINTIDVATSFLMSKLTATTVDISTNGLNGLDTGTEAPNLHYFLYSISDGTTTGLILSLVNESVTGSITVPAGYIYKRQLTFAVTNDGSSNFRPWYCASWGTARPTIRINVSMSFANTISTIAGGNTNVLSNGTATTEATVSCSSIVPPIARIASLSWISNPVGSLLGYVKDPVSGSVIGITSFGTAGVNVGGVIPNFSLNSSQQLRYIVLPGSGPGGGFYLDIYDYTITEIT